MGLKLITAPAHLPVTLAEAKAHARIDGVADDALLTAFISAAVEAAQNMTRRQLVTATYDFTLPAFPARGGVVELPAPPLQTVVGVYYIDSTGAEQPLPSGAYVVDAYGLVAGIRPVAGTGWPSTGEDQNAVRIRFTCGWEMDATVSPPLWTGPESIKIWLLLRVSTMMEHREGVIAGSGVSVADISRPYVDGLLDPYVIPVVV